MDSNRIRVVPPLLYRSAFTMTAGKELEIHFKARDKYGNTHTSGGAIQSVIITNTAQHGFQTDTALGEIQELVTRTANDVKCTVFDRGDGTYVIIGTVYTQGLHDIIITAPFAQNVDSVLVVSGPPYGPHCRLLATNVYQGYTSQQYNCFIALYDRFLNECRAKIHTRSISASVGSSRLIALPSVPRVPTWRVNDRINNIVQLSLIPRQPGTFEFIVKVGGLVVPPSPVSFVVINVSKTFSVRYKILMGYLNRRYSGQTPTFTVNREDVLESSLQLLTTHKTYFHQRFRVRFGKEIGVDAGGVAKEFFHLLSLKLVNPQYALFQSVNGLYKPSQSSTINVGHLFYFEFFGKILAKAITDGHRIPVRFTPSVYKYLLAQDCTLDDLRVEDPTLHMSLLTILNSETDEALQEVAVNFTALRSHFGSLHTVELEEGGEKKMVTMENKKEFINKLCKWHLTECINDQLSTLKQGLNCLIPPEDLSPFSSHELEVIICGQSEVDISFIKSRTSYYGYTHHSNVVQWLWAVLEEFSQDERCRFLQFATGGSSLPSADLGQWSFKVVRGSIDSSKLPQAATCFNSITLPEYESMDVLKRKLQVAISYGHQGFLLS